MKDPNVMQPRLHTIVYTVWSEADYLATLETKSDDMSSNAGFLWVYAGWLVMLQCEWWSDQQNAGHLGGMKMSVVNYGWHG